MTWFYSLYLVPVIYGHQKCLFPSLSWLLLISEYQRPSSIYLSIYFSLFISIYLSIYLSQSVHIYLSICQSIFSIMHITITLSFKRSGNMIIKWIVIFFKLFTWNISLGVRVFVNGPGDRGSSLGRVILRNQKMIFDTAILNTLHYKVRIKCQVEQSRKKISSPQNLGVVAIEKGAFGSPATMVTNFLLYIYIYIYIYREREMCITWWYLGFIL